MRIVIAASFMIMNFMVGVAEADLGAIAGSDSPPDSPPSFWSNSFWGITPFVDRACKFTVNAGGPYRLIRLEVAAYHYAELEGATADFSIHLDSGGLPGSEIAAFHIGGISTNEQVLTANLAADVVLMSGIQYWIVGRATAGQVNWSLGEDAFGPVAWRVDGGDWEYVDRGNVCAFTLLGTNAWQNDVQFQQVAVGSVMGMSFTNALGALYALEVATNLALTQWESTGAILCGNGTTMTFFDPAGTSTSRYYRIVGVSLYNSMSVAGTFNSWNTSSNPLTRISPSTWQGDVTMTGQSSVEFKFVANDSWDTSWGETNQLDFDLPLSGDAEPGMCSNISVNGTLNGTYRFTIEDQHGVYSVRQISTP